MSEPRCVREERFVVRDRNGEVSAFCGSARTARRLRTCFNREDHPRAFDGPHAAYRESWCERKTRGGTISDRFKREVL